MTGILRARLAALAVIAVLVAAALYAAELARGELPSIRRLRRELHVGQDKAQSIQAYLAALTPLDGESHAARQRAADLHHREALSPSRTPDDSPGRAPA